MELTTSAVNNLPGFGSIMLRSLNDYHVHNRGRLSTHKDLIKEIRKELKFHDVRFPGTRSQSRLPFHERSAAIHVLILHVFPRTYEFCNINHGRASRDPR